MELLPDIPGEASAPSDEHNTLGLDSLVSTAVQQSKLDVLLHPVQDQVLVTGASPWQDTPIKVCGGLPRAVHIDPPHTE